MLYSYVGICNGHLDLLLRHGVKPIVVFDGFPLPAKDDERAQRKRKREELLQKSKECERERKQEQAWKLKGQAIEEIYDHVVAFVKVCVERGIPYIVSPFEADAQIALLLSEGYADIAISEDSDFLAYGCREAHKSTNYRLSKLDLPEFQRTTLLGHPLASQ